MLEGLVIALIAVGAGYIYRQSKLKHLEKTNPGKAKEYKNYLEWRKTKPKLHNGENYKIAYQRYLSEQSSDASKNTGMTS